MSRPNPQPNVNRWRTAVRLLRAMAGKYRAALAFVFVCILLSALANVATSFFIKELVDNQITPLLGQANPVFTGVLRLLALMGGVYFAGVLTTFLYNRMMVTVSQGVLKKIRDDMFRHMQRLPIRFYDTHTHGDLMSRYTNDIDALREMLSQSLPQAVSSIATIAVVTVSMLLQSPQLSILAFLCVILMLVIVRKSGKKAAGYFMAQQKSLGNLNGYVEEMMHGQKVIKVFCREGAAAAEFDRHSEQLRGNASEANRLTNIIMPILMNIGTLQYVLIALLGGALALADVGGITTGTIIAFLTLSKSFSGPLGQISMQLNAVIMALAGAERVFALMDEPPETDEGYVTLVNVREENGVLTECVEHTGLWAWRHPHTDGSISHTPLRGEVQFFDVDFGYEPEKPVLKHVTLDAKPGQKIAFVGATGAGKTTITNLINRFYDIADGKIRFDGININKIKKSDLRRSLGIVLQDTHLFTGTVAENIRYGNLDATDEQVEQAARLANAHDFITRLPEGYNTVITGDGGSLSGGQRQLLAIARAAVADPPVMILDEATSSIDTRTEALVQQGMDSLMQGRTVFVIAHRLSTVQNSDAILVLEQGEVVERGSHEALLAEQGRYHRLYTGAFGE